MELFFAHLFSYHTLLLAVVVWIISFFVRRIVELAIPTLKKQADANEPGKTYLTKGAEWWNEVILYAVPVVLGIALAVGIPWVSPELVTVGMRVMWGFVVGWMSSFIYKVLRKILKERVGVDIGDGTGPQQH